MRKKRSFILLEVVVSLALLAILLTLLFQFLVDEKKMQRRVATIKEEVFRRQKCHLRLLHIFDNFQRFNLKDGRPLSPLFLVSDKLFVTFDNGLNSNPKFSGPAQGQLLLDDDHNLWLVVQPISNKEEEKELLLKKVSSMVFQFLEYEEKQKTFSWKEEWPKDAIKTPVMIKLSIKQADGGELSFVFALPQKNLLPMPCKE